MFKTIVSILNSFQSPFLLLMRLYWGWQLFETGKGKLGNIAPVINFFTELGIPYPTMNAYVVGTTELVGGTLLIIGLASRFAALPLTILLTVAYLTADFPAIVGMFSDPESFVQAAPFPFLITSLIVLFFGAGYFSIDTIIAKRCEKPS